MGLIAIDNPMLIRPGDDSANPTISFAYSSAFPFTTTLTQKIEGQQTYTVTRQSVPYQGSTSSYIITTVNPSAHTTQVDSPDGTYTLTTTTGLQTTVRDGRGNRTVSMNDLWGRLVSVTPPTGPSLSYSYDPLDRLTTVNQIGQSGTISTTFTYPDRTCRRSGGARERLGGMDA